ncbi:uncharacterized protein MELLADRAFT_102569 [Melampsora larici-populina 98AG31]|uniref:Threonine/serine exporter-like N-terminal domain-containing protein n=1 Tax=Melampsora larici-populina (strain 98AG31 / pathotype 3-4-7) TaxID=747676 RepID=F4R771_MELLP|nr:uncharacterized protein MELLADRAFT_102569 [Melampsora larici-populina 98AG31]EGG11569.1 hypothetical protein MELLADRAFT_102569 [Melampsora larici-populina 98AG31]
MTIISLHNPPQTTGRKGNSTWDDDEEHGLMSGLGALSSILRLYSRGPETEARIYPNKRSRRNDRRKKSIQSGAQKTDRSETGAEHTADDTEDDRASTSSRLRSRMRRRRRKSVTVQVASVLERQAYILKLSKALLRFGSPGHRLVTQLETAAAALDLRAGFYNMPTLIFVTFGDHGTHTSEIHFVKATGGLDLGRLPRCAEIYKQVNYSQIDVKEGIKQLNNLLNEQPPWNIRDRIIFASLQSCLLCIMAFNGSIADAAICLIYGAFFGYMALHVHKSATDMYTNIFEISMATIFSFLSRALASTDRFCYQSLTSAGLVVSGALELASKNMINGSVKLVYAVIYSLFLGFGTVIGSDMFLLLVPSARSDLNQVVANTQGRLTVTGIFTSTVANMAGDLTGLFTVANTTIVGAATSVSSLEKGSITCFRRPEDPWWTQSALFTPYILIGIVPAFAFLQSVANGQPLRDRQIIAQVVISSCGFLANYSANKFIFADTDVVSFAGSFAVATMGNLYARFFHKIAYTSMATGVMFLLPGGLAAAGGLSMTYMEGQNDNYAGISLALRMIDVAIGITVGLYTSTFLINAIGVKGSGAFSW